MKQAPAFLLATLLVATPAAAQTPTFHLRSGDRVVFFGDSITDQRLYTTFVETFVVTRFPGLDVRFVHSGWGGDRVSGGGGGGIDLRLDRDVIAHRPTVVTVMLGMNDGRYKPFSDETYRTYTGGYERMVRALRAGLPEARLTLIQPSPYDEVTRPLMVGGSYNEVMRRFGAFIKQLAGRERAFFADLNSDLVGVLQRANKRDPDRAQQIVKDRVHPGPAGHLVMAASLLKAWRAPALVSSVELDASGRFTARNAKVYDVVAGPAPRWTQLDAALPMPLDLDDPVVALALESSDVLQALNQQRLRVSGLGAGPWALTIDGERVGVFPGTLLGKGIDLGSLPTPMARQAAEVHGLTQKHNHVHFTRWRQLELPLGKDLDLQGEALRALDQVEEQLVHRQRAAARPRPRRFELTVVPEVAASVPAGFQPTGGDGTPRLVLVAGGARKNAEVHLELAPDAEATALVLRLDEAGRGHRVVLDPREGGALGRVEPAAGRPGKASPVPAWQERWKKGEWNAVRVRVSGDTPQITVWLNGAKLTEWTGGDRSPSAADELGGAIALELSGAAAPRVRNLAVRALP